MSSVVYVTVPPGVAPGQRLLVATDDGSGRTLTVTVPSGMSPGSTFTVQFPAASHPPVPVSPATPKSLKVVVPPGVSPGSTINVMVPDEPGRVLSALVPPLVSEFVISYYPNEISAAAVVDDDNFINKNDTFEASLNQDRIYCPNDHVSVRGIADNPRYQCDVCCRSICKGAILHRCKKCNWDACEQCSALLRVSDEEATSAKLEQMHQEASAPPESPSVQPETENFTFHDNHGDKPPYFSGTLNSSSFQPQTSLSSVKDPNDWSSPYIPATYNPYAKDINTACQEQVESRDSRSDVAQMPGAFSSAEKTTPVSVPPTQHCHGAEQTKQTSEERAQQGLATQLVQEQLRVLQQLQDQVKQQQEQMELDRKKQEQEERNKKIVAIASAGVSALAGLFNSNDNSNTDTSNTDSSVNNYFYY